MSEQFKAFLIALTLMIVFVLSCYGLACLLFPAAHAEGVGTIEIPSINCKFDLSYSGRQLDAHQHIALLFKQQGAICVGNHYGSSSPTGGRWKLENLKLGDKAYLEYVTGDGLEIIHHKGKYICYAIMICDVVDFDFYHNGKEVRPFDPTDLLCVTCVGSDSKRNYVAFFERY